MADTTKIGWTDITYNPWRGCTKISEGCKFCYAETLSKRNSKTLGEWGPLAKRVAGAASYWENPITWATRAAHEGFYEEKETGRRGFLYDLQKDDKENEPIPIRIRSTPRIFCSSLSDVFEEYRGNRVEWMTGKPVTHGLDELRARLFVQICLTINLDYQLLTKRIDMVKIIIPRVATLLEDNPNITGFGREAEERTIRMLRQWSDGFPPVNVWLGTSVENQKAADERIPHLVKMPAKVKFLSVEPMIGAVDFSKVPDFNPIPAKNTKWWVIVGGESGSKCRYFDEEWAYFLLKLCEYAGVAFYMKQLGGHPYKHDKLSDLPEYLRVRQFPKTD